MTTTEIRPHTILLELSDRLRAREVRHARLRKLAAEAMADPDFVADLKETMQVFQHIDKENWPPPLALA